MDEPCPWPVNFSPAPRLVATSCLQAPGDWSPWATSALLFPRSRRWLGLFDFLFSISSLTLRHPWFSSSSSLLPSNSSLALCCGSFARPSQPSVVLLSLPQTLSHPSALPFIDAKPFSTPTLIAAKLHHSCLRGPCCICEGAFRPPTHSASSPP